MHDDPKRGVSDAAEASTKAPPFFPTALSGDVITLIAESL